MIDARSNGAPSMGNVQMRPFLRRRFVESAASSAPNCRSVKRDLLDQRDLEGLHHVAHPLLNPVTQAGVQGLKEATVLWTIAVILVVMWLLGMVSSYTMGGFLHILLVLAIAVVLIRVIQGQRPI
jgi:Family of unknown function (DUF5670)